MLNIRGATRKDAESLHDLYLNHLARHPSTEPQDMEIWRDKITGFEENSLYHLIVGEIDGRVVSSLSLIVIENLTYNLQPYAIIENVVTHADCRGRGYATMLMNRASEIAKSLNCYKIMLLTSSKKDSTLSFYENCGFDRNEKTGFIKRLM